MSAAQRSEGCAKPAWRVMLLQRSTACWFAEGPAAHACAGCLVRTAASACRYLYTKKAMSYTDSVAAQLFDQPVYIVQQLSTIVGWTTLIGLIVVSCLLGVTMLTALLRTYQFSARLPQTSCGELRCSILPCRSTHAQQLVSSRLCVCVVR